MKPSLSTVWNTLSEYDRWQLLNATDMRGLQKCSAAVQPFSRIKSTWREKLERAYALSNSTTTNIT